MWMCVCVYVGFDLIPSWSYNSIALISHRCSVHQTLNLNDESECRFGLVWFASVPCHSIPFINCVEMLDKNSPTHNVTCTHTHTHIRHRTSTQSMPKYPMGQSFWRKFFIPILIGVCEAELSNKKTRTWQTFDLIRHALRILCFCLYMCEREREREWQWVSAVFVCPSAPPKLLVNKQTKVILLARRKLFTSVLSTTL